MYKRVIFDSQWKQLFPSAGNPPDSNVFDITLLHLLLREICNLTAPSTGWHKMPADADMSPEACIVRIKCYRNELCHSPSTEVPNYEFEDKWNKIASSLEALEMIAYRKKLQSLKNAIIDHETRRIEEELEQWRMEKQLEKIGIISEPSSCLPDDIGRIFGRSKQIQEVKEKVQSGKVPVILVTGGPGFGKTTVAKRVAYELDKPENKRTVLFCSLLSKKTFNEVATEMINSCGTVHTQVPENPEQWLKDWSKQIQRQVTFVLDNADDVLEFDGRGRFLSILRYLRMLSRQNITFVITTRKTFDDPDLQPEEFKLEPLSTGESIKILDSRIRSEKEGVSVPKLSKAEHIVELCGCVPLALCIVGSLLSVYPEDDLIEDLEKKPMDVLENDQASVEKAVKTSFDRLKKTEQEALVLMSTFPGSFHSEAAKAVLKGCSIPETLPFPILRSLKARSLMEQTILKTGSKRYQMHPLIHAYARKIGRAEFPNLLARGEKLACVHYMSRLAKNSDMYWSKDRTCKDSLVSFNEDRYNFEYFLQIYAKGREKQDKEIMDGCETFLENLPQKCMYLEKCLLPKSYAETIEKLLSTFNCNIQPVYVVDLLCILGHECRKKDPKKYKYHMQKADEIHSSNVDEFKLKPLSEVYFHNSYARFLAEEKSQSNQKKRKAEKERRDREIAAALNVCYERLGNLHPETAATLLESGIILSSDKKCSESEEQLRKALELFQNCLGNHFMTAYTLKAIADLCFHGRTEADYKKSVEPYEAAVKIFEDLGVGGSKESILTLKNFGLCHMEMGNVDEAMTLLTKAEQVAERELEEIHKWKVLIKISLTRLHDKMGNQEKAKDSMKEGLLIAKKIPLPIDKMGDKHFIRKFINRYPDTFPDNEFPRK